MDGTVVNPPFAKFLPVNKYGNPYTDLFNEALYPKSILETFAKDKL